MSDTKPAPKTLMEVFFGETVPAGDEVSANGINYTQWNRTADAGIALSVLPDTAHAVVRDICALHNAVCEQERELDALRSLLRRAERLLEAEGFVATAGDIREALGDLATAPAPFSGPDGRRDF